MRKFVAAAAVAVSCAAGVFLGSPGAGAAENQDGSKQEYVVVYAKGASVSAARSAVKAAGGKIVKENTEVGVATVQSTNGAFIADAAAASALQGAAHNETIGSVPANRDAKGEAQKFDPAQADLEAAIKASGKGGKSGHAGGKREEPLADLQWDMKQIGATADGSQRYEQGKGIRVGIIDTGVDGTHPDIAPNFDAALSRNFTKDIPADANGDEIDGPCEVPSCVDPNNVDDDGHGTHVASTIASPVNKLGIAGVAPKATIVNLRAGQDSGYFFLQPSVDALTYAGDHGIDVVNMSYYVDPWLFNCTDNPADSPQDQAEQRTVITAMQRALDYAHNKGVTLVSAAGNGATDYTKTIVDASSPDFASEPGEAPYERTIPPSCISMPSEGNHVLAISSTGISKRKAYYSDYGNGYVDLAAPGGDVYDTPDNHRDVTKAVLAAYPERLALESGLLDDNGDPLPDSGIVRNCSAKGVCAYYQYLQGTSMASPHATGVAALAAARWGFKDRVNGGKRAFPDVVEFFLRATATNTPCPTPPAFTYTRILPAGNTVTATHVCEGTTNNNGFYGDGIVDAKRVARGF
jgi:lantibiotic leader peptide-processing serine protease